MSNKLFTYFNAYNFFTIKIHILTQNEKKNIFKTAIEYFKNL